LSFNFLIILILLLLFFVMVYMLHKTRRVHLMQYELNSQYQKTANIDLVFHQIQAFISLERRLNLSYALPPLRGWAASPDFLLLLAEYVHISKPEVIVECSSGASTIVLAQSARLNGRGHVFSFEHDGNYATKSRVELEKQSLSDWATVIDAPLQEYVFKEKYYNWYAIDSEIQSKKIDMLAIDGPPANVNSFARYPAGPLLFPLLNKNAVVFLDDADRPDEREIVAVWQKEFPTLYLEKHNCEKGAVSLINR
jgi:predicted O-methyltransferase YrrM